MKRVDINFDDLDSDEEEVEEVEEPEVVEIPIVKKAEEEPRWKLKEKLERMREEEIEKQKMKDREERMKMTKKKAPRVRQEINCSGVCKHCQIADSSFSGVCPVKNETHLNLMLNNDF